MDGIDPPSRMGTTLAFESRLEILNSRISRLTRAMRARSVRTRGGFTGDWRLTIGATRKESAGSSCRREGTTGLSVPRCADIVLIYD